MQTVWMSPASFVTGDPTLRVSYPFVSHPSTIVTCASPGDLKWVSMGLPLPPGAQIEGLVICYEVSNARSFIAQVRVAEMTTPDHATVIHDDPAHLTSTGPASYTSVVPGLVPSGAVTLELRLNFQDASDEILLGAVGINVQAATERCPCVVAHILPGADALAKIANAILALPSTGGCVDARGLTGTQQQTAAATVTVDRPVTLLLGAIHIKAIASPTFMVSAVHGRSNLTVLGLDSTSTVIEANQPNVTLFQFVGDFFDNDGDGAATFAVKHCGLWGGSLSGTVMLDTQTYPTTNFQDGLLLIEDNLITNFGDTALKIGASVYFNRVHRNQFLYNNIAVSLDNNTEASITENNFDQGPHGGPSIVSVGPMHRIVNNYFTRNIISDDSNAPDILLQPEAAWESQAGGYVWIEDNRFMVERENLDPARRRIKLASSPTTIIAGPAIVKGNQFLGPRATGYISASGTTATMALDSTQGYVTQGLVPGVTQVTIYNANELLLNGTFVVESVINSTQFTYTLTAPATASDVSGAVHLTDATAIELDNPHLPWDVHGNLFEDYGILINDNQCPPETTQNTAYGWGQSLFFENRAICPPGGYRVFANEGNNFTLIRPPANASAKVFEVYPRQHESLILQNWLSQSERLDLWTPVNGITPAIGGQADPFGTNRAFQLMLNGTMPDQHIRSENIDLNGVAGTSRLIITFWAKQGTLSSLAVGLYDVTRGSWYGNFFTVSLGGEWKRYKLVTNQLYSLTDAFQLLIYPGLSDAYPGALSVGTVSIFAPQISDGDSDYYPTVTGSLSDELAGSRFEKAVILTSLKTTTRTGDVSSAPTVTASGLGAGSPSLEAGSSDMSGVVLLSPGIGATNSGTVTITYNVGYSGANAPIVIASLQDTGLPTWTAGNSQVRVSSSLLSSCTLAWVNSSALTAGATYAIAYIVLGRT